MQDGPRQPGEDTPGGSVTEPDRDAGVTRGPEGATAPLPPPVQRGVMRRFLAWARRHPFRSVLVLLGLYVLFETATIPWFGVGKLRTTDPSVTALMRQRLEEASARGQRFTIVHRWVPISRLPRHLLNAVVVAEDGTFFTHGGIDWFEVRESIGKNFETGRAARGASTITQQLAKNLYLSTSKDPVRKLKEVVITMLMEAMLTKERILELYVNLIEWGPGIFGVEAAARTYFGKDASALSLEESLRLAAVIPSPLRHRPDSDSRYVLRRKEIVRVRLLERRWLRGPVPSEEPDEEESVTPADSRSTGDSLSMSLPDSSAGPGLPEVPEQDKEEGNDSLWNAADPPPAGEGLPPGERGTRGETDGPRPAHGNRVDRLVGRLHRPDLNRRY